jgi:hypothetical protein
MMHGQKNIKSSIEVQSTVMRRRVWYRHLKNVGVMARFGPQSHRKKKFHSDEHSNCRNWEIHTILRPEIPVLQPTRAFIKTACFSLWPERCSADGVRRLLTSTSTNSHQQLANSTFQVLTVTLSKLLYAFFWVIPLRLNFICRRFGTLRDPPLPYHPPSYWLRLFSSQTFSRINTPTFSNLVILHTYPPMKMEVCSETSAYKIQTPGNHPEESIQHSEHGESFKSRILSGLLPSRLWHPINT